MPQTVARVLGVRELPGDPLISTLASALQGRHLLIILDNCEHLLAACVGLAYRLLRACPELQILTTSREVMGIGGETAWRVPPLTLPDQRHSGSLDQIAESEAVALFIERAQAAQPGFSLTEQNADATVEVCRRLDGMPLAIELAAARVRVLALEQIAARLTDRFRLLTTRDRTAPTRQQTLRATIDWSYGLLSEPERLLFDRLSIFAGGWTLGAAEAAGGGNGIEPDEVADRLERLADQSLVVVEPPAAGTVRYGMLETLREYGREQLGRRGGGEMESAQQRHAVFFLQFAERAEAEIFGLGHLAGLELFEQEHDNIRAALRWQLDNADVEGMQRLAGATRPFWGWRGHLNEGRALLTEALALETKVDEALLGARGGTDAFANGPTLETGEAKALTRRAKVLHGIANLAAFQSDYSAAHDADAAALALWQQLGDDAGASYSLCVLGQAAMFRGDLAMGRQFLAQGIDAGRASGALPPLALNLMYLSQLACDEGDLAGARLLGEEAVMVGKQSGYARASCQAVAVLGDVAYQAGNPAAARELLHEALSGAREIGDRMLMSWALAGLGRIAIDEGDHAGAGSSFDESLKLARDLGDRLGIAQRLEDVARLAALLQRPADALRFAAAAAAGRDSIGAPMRPSERIRLDPCLDAVREELGGAAAGVAWLEGQGRSLDQTIAAALELLRSLSVDHGGPSHGAAPNGGRSLTGRDALTPREREVAALMARGRSNRRIAQDLVISEKTAANHVAHILDKLALASRAELAAIWDGKEEPVGNP